MISKDEFERLFGYDHWANREVLASLRPSPGAAPPARAIRFMGHILAAQQLWLDRLEAHSPAGLVWPDWTLDAVAERVETQAAEWRGYLLSLEAARLPAQVAYVNSKGERWVSRVCDILLHVVMHGVYHRGQIATGLRDAGQVPAYTDFIQAVRTGELDRRP
jgi:uncharacterized damage-inducible protein DinB